MSYATGSGTFCVYDQQIIGWPQSVSSYPLIKAIGTHLLYTHERRDPRLITRRVPLINMPRVDLMNDFGRFSYDSRSRSKQIARSNADGVAFGPTARRFATPHRDRNNNSDKLVLSRTCQHTRLHRYGVSYADESREAVISQS